MRKYTESDLLRMTRLDLVRVFKEMQETLGAKSEDVTKYAVELHKMEEVLIAANNNLANYRDWFTEHEHIIHKEIYLKKALAEHPEHGDNALLEDLKEEEYTT